MVISGTKSVWTPGTLGVPHGSLLIAFLFNVLINNTDGTEFIPCKLAGAVKQVWGWGRGVLATADGVAVIERTWRNRRNGLIGPSWNSTRSNGKSFTWG